jgi:mono/diheme cytochrome c family protein
MDHRRRERYRSVRTRSPGFCMSERQGRRARVAKRVGTVIISVVIVAIATIVYVGRSSPSASNVPASLVERGRYLVRIAGCNDCHTPRYAETGGAVPESEWLTGDAIGWHGPWGTTYAINLRLQMNAMSERQWLAMARAFRSRPPMPWFALRDMTDDDLRAIYQFVRSLGVRGEPAPAYIPPDRVPPMPYIEFLAKAQTSTSARKDRP